MITGFPEVGTQTLFTVEAEIKTKITQRPSVYSVPRGEPEFPTALMTSNTVKDSYEHCN